MSLVKKAFADFAGTKQRKFGRARMKTVGASEVGRCIRQIGYIKHDNPSDSNRTANHEDTWGAARRGNTFEDGFFVPAMRKAYGPKLLLTGKAQQTFTYGLLSATPDGILVDQPSDVLADLMVPDIGPSGQVLVECKSIDPRVSLQSPKVEHFIQVQVQMGVLREATTTYRPEFAVIVYTNASFFDDVVEFVVRYDPKVFYQAQVRAKKILDVEHATDLKPEGWIAGGNECTYCAFSAACKLARAPTTEPKEPVKLDQQFLAHAKALADEEKKWTAIASSAEENKRNIQEEIKVLMREKGLRKIKAEDISINWSTVVGRPSFDMPKLRAAAAEAGLNLQQFERVGEPTDRMVINVLKRDRLVSTPASGKLGTGNRK